jgi:hypothetical protein
MTRTGVPVIICTSLSCTTDVAFEPQLRLRLPVSQRLGRSLREIGGGHGPPAAARGPAVDRRNRGARCEWRDSGLHDDDPSPSTFMHNRAASLTRTMSSTVPGTCISFRYVIKRLRTTVAFYWYNSVHCTLAPALALAGRFTRPVWPRRRVPRPRWKPWGLWHGLRWKLDAYRLVWDDIAR